MSRATPFADIVRHLTPFFVSRQVVCGAGRVGRGADGRDEGFQISQRADFFEVEVGLETTLKRPIINTRDEPHADPEKYRRLHVIIGDANMSEISSYLKLGVTSREVDWVAKLEVLEGYRARDGLSWTHPRLQLVDLQYSDIRPERGVYNRLAANGRMLRLVDEQDVARAIEYPPEDTRAYFRG